MRSEKSTVRLDPGLEMLAERLAHLDTDCAIATVFSATGSTYSKPGARMLIETDGRITGLLSGGCLEQDLREHAGSVLANGTTRTVTYDMRPDNDLLFGIGAGCEGCMEILLEPAGPGSRARLAITRASEWARQGRPAVLAVLYEGPAQERGTHLWHASEQQVLARPLAEACALVIETSHARDFRWQDTASTQAAWIQPLLPLPAILICGAGPDAVPLAAALRALRFPVTVTDHRPAYAQASSFPGVSVVQGPAATLATRLELTRFFGVVVMSHHLASDVDYLRALGRTELNYLGVLGPQRRRQRLLAELGTDAAALEERLRGPIGLKIGAVTPEGIALAIAAEIHGVAASHAAKAARDSLSIAGEAPVTKAARAGSVL